MFDKIFKRDNKNYKIAMEQIDHEIGFFMDQREYFVEALADASDDNSRAEIQDKLDTATIAQHTLEELRDRIKIRVMEEI